jgi:hypothetical protein
MASKAPYYIQKLAPLDTLTEKDSENTEINKI